MPGQDPNGPMLHPDMGPPRGTNLPPKQNLPPKRKPKGKKLKAGETTMKPYPTGVLPDSGVRSNLDRKIAVAPKKKTTKKPTY